LTYAKCATYRYSGMADSPLIECWHKIGRAENHLHALTTEVTAFVDAKPFATVERYESKQSKYLFQLRIIKPIPQVRWALIIGDCVHNLRAALDYIAWRLAGSDLADRSTLFPIYETEYGFNQMVKRRKLDDRIHPDALIEIRRCQPYERPNPEVRPLWLLNELDARDKHKLLTMTQGLPFGGAFHIQGPRNVEGNISINRYSCLEDGAVFAEIQFPVSTPESEVKVDASFMFDITFDKGIVPSVVQRGVLWHLPNIVTAVKEVVARFEALIAQNPHWSGPTFTAQKSRNMPMNRGFVLLSGQSPLTY
jgi:hypothetical protein